MRPFSVGIQGDLASDVYEAIEARLRTNASAGLRWSRTDVRSFHPLPPSAATEFDALIIAGPNISEDSFLPGARVLIISRWGVGYDMIDLTALSARNIALTITPGAIRYPTAEAILAMIFGVAKNIVEADAVVRAGKWKTDLSRRAVDIRGSTLGSFGYGNIAKSLFEISRSVGFARFLVHDHHADAEMLLAQGIEAVTLDELCAQSDFLTVNVPLTERTRGILGSSLLHRMKPTAFLINTARGAIVDEAALGAHLDAGGIAGAALDVFGREPPPARAPLLEAPRTLLSPHALAQTPRLSLDAAHEAVDNVLAVARGENPSGLVNREILGAGRFPARLAEREQNA